MKRLIFDIDNTLIKWETHYTSALIKTMKQFNVDYDYMKIDNVIEEQEKKYDMMNRENLLKDINKETNLNLDIDFVNTLLENQKELAIVDQKVIDTLAYLKEKYELVILTNYFIDTQKGRLEKAKILEFFTEFYGGDTVKLKPNPESFKIAANGQVSIMIGDSMECDVMGALNAGLDVIQVDYFNKHEKTNHPLIRDFSELKNIL